jgi:Tol biopolymer transport system component
VFEALGRLWLRDVAGGEARLLTRDDSGAFELFPSWSRDGRQMFSYAGQTLASAKFTSSRAAADVPAR